MSTLGVLCAVVPFLIANAAPAGASPKKCVDVTNHRVVYAAKLVHTDANQRAFRDACYTIAILGDPFGVYYFQVQAQDMQDIAQAGYVVDDQGEIWIEYQTPGTTPWHAWTHDQNSADWTVAWGTQGPYNAILNGDATRWNWRIHISTHVKARGALIWSWHDWYSPSFNLPR